MVQSPGRQHSVSSRTGWSGSYSLWHAAAPRPRCTNAVCCLNWPVSTLHTSDYWQTERCSSSAQPTPMAPSAMRSRGFHLLPSLAGHSARQLIPAFTHLPPTWLLSSGQSFQSFSCSLSVLASVLFLPSQPAVSLPPPSPSLPPPSPPPSQVSMCCVF